MKGKQLSTHAHDRGRFRKLGVKEPPEAVVRGRGGERLGTELVDGPGPWEMAPGDLEEEE